VARSPKNRLTMRTLCQGVVSSPEVAAPNRRLNFGRITRVQLSTQGRLVSYERSTEILGPSHRSPCRASTVQYWGLAGRYVRVSCEDSRASDSGRPLTQGGNVSDDTRGAPAPEDDAVQPTEVAPGKSPWPQVVLALGVVLIVAAAAVAGVAMWSRDVATSGNTGSTPATGTPNGSPMATSGALEDLSAEELASRYGDTVWRVEADGCGYVGIGTAFAVGPRTLITNAHVVDIDATPMVVSRDGRTSLRATVVGSATDVDIAVMVVDRDLPGGSLSWVRAESLSEGQTVVALGYPVPDNSFTVSPATVISFQTDGPSRQALRLDGLVDKGNSGGPVLTSAGGVAGVATFLLGGEATGGLQLIGVAHTYDYLAEAIRAIERDRPGLQVTCDQPPSVPIAPDDWSWDDEPDWSVFGPNGYGDDPQLDGLYDACGAGDMEACDNLYWQSSYGSEYESFAIYCGGATDEPAWGYCSWTSDGQGFNDAGNPETFGDDPLLDELWTACANGNMAACDDLYAEAPIGSEYESFGATCGETTEGNGLCDWDDGFAGGAESPTRYGDDPYLDDLWNACADGDLDSCDTLYYDSEIGSDYEEFGATCGGRYDEPIYGTCSS
jgi:S1-C subfamily serine protease